MDSRTQTLLDEIRVRAAKPDPEAHPKRLRGLGDAGALGQLGEGQAEHEAPLADGVVEDSHEEASTTAPLSGQGVANYSDRSERPASGHRIAAGAQRA